MMFCVLWSDPLALMRPQQGMGHECHGQHSLSSGASSIKIHQAKMQRPCGVGPENGDTRVMRVVLVVFKR